MCWVLIVVLVCFGVVILVLLLVYWGDVGFGSVVGVVGIVVVYGVGWVGWFVVG